MKCTVKYKLHIVLEVGKGVVKDWVFKGLRNLEKISFIRSGGRRVCRQLLVESIFL